MRWRSWGLLGAAIAFVPVAPARATVPVVVIDGHGFGHGVGMAQDGAFWMAKEGATAPQILGHFYPGTSLGKVSKAAVRVAVFTDDAATITLPEGGRVEARSPDAGPGFPIRLAPGAQVRLRRVNGRVAVDTDRPTAPVTTTTAAPTTTTTARPTLLTLASTTTSAPPAPVARPAAEPSAPSAGVVALTPSEGGSVTVADRGRTYRGFVDAYATDTGIKLVNQVDVEHYLRGMGEVRDPTWPAAALRTQAVAARTYALRAMGAAGEICDGQRCQVYLGRQAEYAAMDKAVAATAGQVLVFEKGLASAVYSSNGGGHSATREEGFGTSGGNYPYLRAAPYVTQNPLPWNATVALNDIGARLGGGAVSNVEVLETGPSGRALTVALDGPSGRRTVSGLAFARALGLRSTMFTTRLAEADVAPDAPAAGAVIQAPPDEIALSGASTPQSANSLTPLSIDLPDRPRSGRNANTAAERGSAAALLAILGGAVWLAMAATRRRHHRML